MALLLLLCACATKEQAIAAGATAAIAVAAAAAHRAATDYCWGACSNGYVCDRKTGECVLPEELEVDPAPASSAAYDGSCIQEDDGRTVCPDDPPPTNSAAPADPCRGLCVEGEQCEEDAGVADCAPKK
ncbi:MAG TPA: hypothetical protein VFB62_16375 [Polyangiaceae bacterium]|nr:hypothetical protein [Polyangiaceae bacterium]